jgi:hypothetical protein
LIFEDKREEQDYQAEQYDPTTPKMIVHQGWKGVKCRRIPPPPRCSQAIVRAARIPEQEAAQQVAIVKIILNIIFKVSLTLSGSIFARQAVRAVFYNYNQIYDKIGAI